jgi:5-oxoprolinase (ATP-hydrolysing)
VPIGPAADDREMPPALYFAYGSNLDVEQMVRRCPSAQPLEAARLLHHCLDFTVYSQRWRGGAADVLLRSEQEVWGGLYRVPEHELFGLDRYEAGYTRVWIDVHTRASRVLAHTYRAREQRSFEPSPRYLDTLLRSARSWGFPLSYVRALERRAGARSQPQ